MKGLEVSSLGMVRCQPSSSQTDTLGGFEELAMPLFDSLYNFARWLARNQIEAEDLVQETHLQALRGYASFALWHQLSGTDIPIFEEHLSGFLRKTRPARDDSSGV